MKYIKLSESLRYFGRFAQFATIIILMLCAACSQVHAEDATLPEVSNEHRKLLADIDLETASKIVTLYDKIVTVEKEVQRYQQSLQSASESAEAGRELAASNEKIRTLILDFAKKELRALTKQAVDEKKNELTAMLPLDRIKTVLETTNEPWRLVPYDSERDFDVDEAGYREGLQELVDDLAAGKIYELVTGDEFRKKLESLRSPAEYVKKFAEGKLTEFLTEPRKWPGTEFTLRIEKPAPSTLLFSPDANLKLVIQYQEGIEVSASGLYFEYKDKGLPLPKFEQVRPDEPNLSSLLNIGLDKLGDVIPENFDLPVTVKKVRFNDFNQPDGKVPPGSLSFDIVASFPMAEAFKAEIENVNIAPNGKVAAPNGLKFENSTIRIPLGTTGLDMFTINGAIRPKDPDRKHVTFGTKIVPAQTQNLLELKTEAIFGFPLKRVDLKGTLLTSGMTLGEFKGYLSPVLLPKEIHGSLWVGKNVPALDRFVSGECEFHLDKTQLWGNGDLTMYQAIRGDFDLEVVFGSHAIFTGSNGISLADFANARTSVLVHADEGFKKLHLQADTTAGLDLRLTRIAATVEINAYNDRSPPVIVVVRGGGQEATLEFDAIPKDLKTVVQNALMPNLEDILQGALDSAKELEELAREQLPVAEKAVREEAARFERSIADGISHEAKKYGVDALRTGNDEVDKHLGEIADTWKTKLGGGSLNNIGGEISNGFKKLNPFRSAESFSVRSVDENIPEWDDLRLLAGAINETEFSKGHVIEDKTRSVFDRRSTNQNYSAGAVRLFDAIPSVASDTEVLLPFTIRVARFQRRANAEGLTGDSSSAIRAAFLYFKEVQTDGEKRFTANIVVPDVDNQAGNQTTDDIRNKLQDLIERYMPYVEIIGKIKRYERQLAVNNTSREDLTVWCKMYRRKVVNKSLKWQWTPDSDRWFKTRVAAGEKLLLTELNGIPRRGSMVRIHAVTDTGRSWAEFKRDPYLLVQENDEGDAFYRSKKFETRSISVSDDDLQGAEPIKVPQLVDADLETAISRLDSRGLRVSNEQIFTVNREGSRASDVSLVEDQKPAAGELVAPGSEVVVYLRREITKPPKRIEVPDLEDTTVEQARQQLERVRLSISPKSSVIVRNERRGKTAKVEHQVIGQDPEPGTDVRAGSEVTLSLAEIRTVPDNRKAIPDVSELPLDEAESVLRRAGFTNLSSESVVESTRVANEGTTRTEVIDQEPSPGALVAVDGEIHLSYATIRIIRDVRFSMPRLPVNYESAKGVLLAHNLRHKLNIISTNSRLGQVAGVVYEIEAQKPSAGAAVRHGDLVSLNVTKVVTTVPQDVSFRMPPLAGKTLDEAKRVIADRGLRLDPNIVRRTIRTEGSVDRDTTEVVGQSPAVLAKVNRGDVVRLTIEQTIQSKPAKIRIPVLPDDPKRAQQLLAGMGLRPVLEERDREVREGQVYREQVFVTGRNPRTSPAENTLVAPGTEVHVYLIRIVEQPRKEGRMPRLAGMNLQAALRVLRDLGLNLQTDLQKQAPRTANVPQRDVVTETNPPSGQIVREGDIVRVEYRDFIRPNNNNNNNNNGNNNNGNGNNNGNNNGNGNGNSIRIPRRMRLHKNPDGRSGHVFIQSGGPQSRLDVFKFSEERNFEWNEASDSKIAWVLTGFVDQTRPIFFGPDGRFVRYVVRPRNLPFGRTPGGALGDAITNGSYRLIFPLDTDAVWHSIDGGNFTLPQAAFNPITRNAPRTHVVNEIIKALKRDNLWRP